MDLLKQLFSSKTSAKDVASDRLKLILIHDRATLSPDLLDNIKADILNCISKYVEIDNGDVDVKMANMDEIPNGSPALIASIPIKRIK
ncbi:cell division topological specificity factor MinE [Oceanirhabdus sp. W0125-5]|uniref:cell division topological specificity factor MinE n=1 Tax=Oceanirhabdus sp. W0125-5 TaxID=2999116 RepID=UPI0022F31FB6|nr:cell division topological specificity factor MinE [Oceanirhabdus sp. W0125-5]WBW95860.1 cell division topological specificity factor MinE [Oceanirhabdus sp. W0125-5]